MIAGKDAPRHGEAKNSWLTGTAAWTFVNVSQFILGIQPDFKGLRIDPCIPKEWDQLKVIRQFRSATFFITIKNPEHVEKGVRSILVDGQEWKGSCICPDGRKQEYFVTVRMGAGKGFMN